jgi:hypothetical protein
MQLRHREVQAEEFCGTIIERYHYDSLVMRDALPLVAHNLGKRRRSHE